MSMDKKAPEKSLNQLGIKYEYAKKHYGGLATAWKKDFITDADYQLFNKIYKYKPIEQVPAKYFTAINYLNALISKHAELMREFKQGSSSSQLSMPMV